MSGVRASLRVPGFAALLASYVVNRAGDVVGALALAVVVLAATGSAFATALLFLATQFMPGLVGPALVARIDHLAAGRILPALYAIESVLFLALAALVHRSGVAPPQLYVVTRKCEVACGRERAVAAAQDSDLHASGPAVQVEVALQQRQVLHQLRLRREAQRIRGAPP